MLQIDLFCTTQYVISQNCVFHKKKKKKKKKKMIIQSRLNCDRWIIAWTYKYDRFTDNSYEFPISRTVLILNKYDIYTIYFHKL